MRHWHASCLFRARPGGPGQGPHLDSDNDGIGCEPYRGR
ncbi:excalibur calcium-binding domain-containing protein [Pseudoxanthomonas wuyuanensis]